jgi:uncharacterized protein (TIGR02453 family)
MANFKGFPKEFITFFENLKQNNSKDWFEKHRKDYEELVLHPAREFVEEMGKKLRRIAPAVHAIPKINQSLFKINRDVRFSKDKSPYKTTMGIWFWEGSRKRMECSGFYFHLEDKRLLIGTGIYMFPKELIASYRQAVVDKRLGPKLKRAVKNIVDKGYSVGGKHYKKVPRGFDADLANAEFLLYNGLHAMAEAEIPDEFYSDALISYTFTHYKNMLPLHQWLKKATGKE